MVDFIHASMHGRLASVPRIFHAKTAYQAVLTQLAFFAEFCVRLSRVTTTRVNKNRAKLEGRQKDKGEKCQARLKVATTKYKMI